LPNEKTNNELLDNLKSIQMDMKHYMHGYFKQYNLTPPQGLLVFLLNQKKTLKISEISLKMGLSNSTVSGIVDRLEAQGLVERIRSQEDRRVVLVQLTKEMCASFASHEQIFESLIEEALKDLSINEKNIICKNIEKLSQNIKKVVKEKSND
jgi:DNA-binding MarR family transcriptional regulator